MTQITAEGVGRDKRGSDVWWGGQGESQKVWRYWQDEFGYFVGNG